MCLKAQRAICDAGVDPVVADAVATAYTTLCDGHPVSVRSSATAEDQPWGSFAGQYDSFLNVRGAEVVLDRLVAVWQSLYSPHAVAYRRRLAIPDEAVAMAVVVQRQLFPESAGVLLTRDPISGDDGRFFINSSFGLGEGVVTGDVPSDTFALANNTLELLSQNLGKKSAMVTADAGGGTSLVPVPPSRQDMPSLSEGQLIDLGRLGQEVMRLFNGHQDVEFATQNDIIYLLQARPITGSRQVEPFKVDWEDPADSRQTWARAHMAIGTGRTLTLQQDAIRAYLEGGRAAGGLRSAPPSDPQQDDPTRPPPTGPCPARAEGPGAKGSLS